MLHRPTASVLFGHDASYLLVGGLGDMRSSIARLLVRLRARYPYLMSRFGDRTSAAQMLRRESKAHGTEITVYCCDVARKINTGDQSNDYTVGIPPCEGVFQGAMALRDILCEKTSRRQWNKLLLPRLSDAITFINFKDVPAQYCVASGLKAVTIDLGIMCDVVSISEQG